MSGEGNSDGVVVETVYSRKIIHQKIATEGSFE